MIRKHELIIATAIAAVCAGGYLYARHVDRPSPVPPIAAPARVVPAVYQFKVKVPSHLREHVHRAARNYGLEPELLARLIQKESNWNPAARSKVGACGLAQFMPATAAQYRVDCTDPLSSIYGAAWYLSDLQVRFKSQGLALAAYNWGPTNLAAWLGDRKQAVPAETQDYVAVISGKPLSHWAGRNQLATLASL